MLYLLLLAVALVAGYLAYRRASAPIFVASVVGMAASLGITDILTAGILRLYIFRPHLAPTASQDHPLGFFLSDFMAVPLLYVAAAAFFPHRPWVASLGLAGVLALIEYGFLRAGVYIHQGWSIWYSIPLFILRFLLAAWWVPKLARVGYIPAFRAFLIGLSIHFIWFWWAIWTSSIFRVWMIRPGLLAVPDADRVLGMALYHWLPFTALGGLAVWLGWGRSVRGLLLTGGLFLGYLWWLAGSGLWRGWSPVYEATALTLLVGVAAALDRWFAAQLPAQVKAGAKGW